MVCTRLKGKKRNLKVSSILILMFFGFNSYGQFFEGLIIRNNGDTTLCEIILPNYLNGQLNYSTLTKRITTKTKGGKIHRYKPTEITRTEIQISENDKITFVSIPQDRKQFFQENVNGKLSLFTLHINNSGFAAPVLRKDGKLTYLNVVNKRKRVGNLISDSPELFNDWENDKYDFMELEKVVKIYNEYFEIKK